MLVNLRLRLSSVYENINRVEEFVGNIISSFGIDVFYQGKFVLAVEEAAINAIRHGNKNNPNKFFTIEFNYSKDYFDFTVFDEGDGFSIDFQDCPVTSANKECGRGVFLMKTLADELIYKSSESRVTMRFYNNVKSIA